MSLDIAPAGGEGAPASEPASTPAPSENVSVSEIARQLSQRRWEKARQSSAPEPQANPEPVIEWKTKEEEFAPEASAAPQDADPGETREAEPVAELPPIEPPRSWTKDEKDRFSSLPRETQEYVAQREQERERAIRQSQNEAAEARKAADAERARVEQARQQYESKLPELIASLQASQAGQFADVKTPQDVQRLATEDPLRYLQWTAHQQQVSAVQHEMQQAQQRQAQDFQQRWNDFASKEDSLTVERIPELKDAAKRSKIQDSARTYLTDIGFTESELAQAWNGQTSFSPRDHRFQMLVMDGLRYREGKANFQKAVTAKPPPQVQRPGTAPARPADSALQSLSKQLDKTGDARDAAALVIARRAAAARR
jgi:hypothetical protein